VIAERIRQVEESLLAWGDLDDAEKVHFLKTQHLPGFDRNYLLSLSDAELRNLSYQFALLQAHFRPSEVDRPFHQGIDLLRDAELFRRPAYTSPFSLQDIAERSG